MTVFEIKVEAKIVADEIEYSKTEIQCKSCPAGFNNIPEPLYKPKRFAKCLENHEEDMSECYSCNSQARSVYYMMKHIEKRKWFSISVNLKY